MAVPWSVWVTDLIAGSRPAESVWRSALCCVVRTLCQVTRDVFAPRFARFRVFGRAAARSQRAGWEIEEFLRQFQCLDLSEVGVACCRSSWTVLLARAPNISSSHLRNGGSWSPRV